MNKRMVLGLLAAGLACTLVAGCGAKVSKSNYDKIADGMTVAQVEDILGKGAEEAGASASPMKYSLFF